MQDPVPGERLRVHLFIFDQQSRADEAGAVCVVLANAPDAPVRVVCELAADHTQVELDPTLPFADALLTFLAAKYQHGPPAADKVIARPSDNNGLSRDRSLRRR